ncbi:winged helix-turn-helix transcriptional regulator [Aeromonas hydrophila]|uniref:Winged helix-turn-helix transcriptional regulator n=1 Tax=Aeromonas hydrophila TaxID=644 RepID=A0A926IZ34_AERHY|nr:winged helix-turn-helix transcriptional regulator [Aeromonas hydrophila]
MQLEEMEANASRAVALLKALANERRLFILCQLLERELSVGELNERLGLSQSALSQHLAVLRRDELVETRKEAQTVYYSLRSHEVREMIGLLHKLYCSEQNKKPARRPVF